ncbi:response regulator [Candidatus Dependentiae bacterium]|nr:response regulator [Candidatus Dependentiae bacterium]
MHNKKPLLLNVDDYDAGRYATTRILTMAGFTVIEAETGEEALRKVKEEKPDLVILDINLPDIDGFEVCRGIKEEPSSKLLPVLHLSATFTDTAAKVKGLEGGADGYLTQPVEPLVLIATIKSLLRLKDVEAEAVLMASQWESTFDAISSSVFLLDLDCRILRCNKATEKLFNKTQDEIIGRHCWEWMHGANKPIPECPMTSMKNDCQRKSIAFQADERWLQITVDPILDEAGNLTGAVHAIDDITERINLQAQLIQAQKMESVGRLASGVAHDYNNILSVILGYTELALDKVGPNDPLHADLMEILAAAKRSADITRQLLAFARKQIVAPKVLALNETLEAMFKLLRQLIGEDIDLSWNPRANLWAVKIDPSQLDQILVNLCVNARDAIAGVGKVTIETDKVTLDAAYCDDHAGFIPGDFVLLAVSDNGSGMDKETLGKLFEPFFTTKGVGRGTGLGLATVYGIVKQNKGFINVYSEIGKGTTFRIYLPRHAGDNEEMSEETTEEIPRGRGETVLVVEDEASILQLANRILKDLGYSVLTAKTPGKAMGLAKEHADSIHLLITDVVMPEMNGRELAERMLALYPGLKVLFMSGYTSDVIAHRGVLDEGVNFIQKPFPKKDMAAKVRAALDTVKP